jgi:hypothetical protein
MSEPYLITGLPRSRTAWMATAASGEGSMCFHEPTAWLDRWDDVFAAVWWDHPNYRYVGIADHGLGFHLPAIMRRASPRTLIIERPVDEVNASLARLGLPASNFCDLLQETLAYDHPCIMRVPYAVLADSWVVFDCLRWLMPEEVIDRSRIAHLQGRNIQAGPNAIPQAMARSAEVANFIPAEVLRRLRAI